MSSWLWAALAVALLAGVAVLLGACKRGYDNPIVLATIAVADAVNNEGPSQAEQDQWNRDAQAALAALRARCDGIEAWYRDTARLKAHAAEVQRLGLAVGHDIMEQRLKACVAFHAEAAGDYETAYKLYFVAAVDSLYERGWIAEHGGAPKLLTDPLHYGVIDAILRLRAAGHAREIYHIGADKVTSYTCARLRAEAPQYATCR